MRRVGTFVLRAGKKELSAYENFQPDAHHPAGKEQSTKVNLLSCSSNFSLC
jgi:hypothetical protein